MFNYIFTPLWHLLYPCTYFFYSNLAPFVLNNLLKLVQYILPPLAYLFFQNISISFDKIKIRGL